MSLSDKWREKAASNTEGSNALFDEADFATNPKKQVLATIGQVNATIYSALADLLDDLSVQRSAGADAVTEKRRAMLRRTNDIRTAAARGDWDEFDRLAAGDGPAEPSGDEPGGDA